MRRALLLPRFPRHSLKRQEFLLPEPGSCGKENTVAEGGARASDLGRSFAF